MIRRCVALFGAPAALVALSCGSAKSSLEVPHASPLAKPSAQVGSAASELPAIAPSRVEVAAPTPVPLEIASILPVWGDDTAVFVSQFAGERATYFQRIDGGLVRQDEASTNSADFRLKQGSAMSGPIVTLADENVFAAFAHGDDLTIASTHDATICLTTYRGTEVATRRCEAKLGTVLLPLGQRFVILSAKPPDPEEKPKKPGEKAHTEAASKKPQRAKPSKKKPSAHQEVKVAADPRKLSLERQLLTEDGGLDGDSEPTGLLFTAPMAGMDFVTGTSSGARARALYYEWAGSVKNAKTGVLGRARLALGSLDDTGTYDEASRSELPETDLMFGFLADHQEPRLYTTSKGALYLGLTSSRGKCEARVVSPFSMPLIPDDTLCAVDPRGYFELAEAVRAAQKAGSPVGRTGFPTAPTITPVLTKSRRAYAQADYDPERTASWGERAYAMSGDDAVTFTKTDAATTLPRPLVAQRSRIRWAAFAPDGSGVAGLEHGTAQVSEQGNLSLDPVTTDSQIPLARTDVAEIARRSYAKVGSTWWQSRGELLAWGRASKPLRRLPPDTAVLVGGADVGLVIEVGSGTMRVERFDPKSSSLTALGNRKPPVRPGFDAVERKAGGAIVAGISSESPPRVVAFAIAPSGDLGPVRDTGLSFDPSSPVVRLSALPGGGALLTDLGRREVVWLDDAGAALAKANWPSAPSDAVCVDGWPAPPKVPTPRPGNMAEVPGFASPGTCITGEIAWAPDGSLRWFGSTSAGPHTRAELGRIPTDVAALASARASGPASAGAAPTFTPLDKAAKLACPSDMVLVQGRVCVDRFEDALRERGSSELLSPDVAPTASLMSVAMGEWSTRRERVGDLFARALPLPFVSPLELGRNIDVVAVSRMGIRPSGYVTGVVAKSACEAAEKRLCSLDEWKTACRGADDTLFPYGPDYEDGVCNVNREAHPAALLHGHSSLGHLDPRLNYAEAAGSPLFHKTGKSPRCASRWGDDAIYDMVGNLDEWVDDGAGAFAGGFYSRGTKSGCGALVENHPASYLDYSTGVRCCKDASQ